MYVIESTLGKMEDGFQSCTYLSSVRRYHPNHLRSQVHQSSLLTLSSNSFLRCRPKVSTSAILKKEGVLPSLSSLPNTGWKIIGKFLFGSSSQPIITFPEKKIGKCQHCNVLHSGLVDVGNQSQIKRESCVDQHASGPQDNSPTSITACVTGSSQIRYCLHYILMQLVSKKHEIHDINNLLLQATDSSRSFGRRHGYYCHASLYQ